MNISVKKNNYLIFLSILSISIFFNFFSYHFFTNEFHEIEKRDNVKKVNTLINYLDLTFINLDTRLEYTPFNPSKKRELILLSKDNKLIKKEEFKEFELLEKRVEEFKEFETITTIIKIKETLYFLLKKSNKDSSLYAVREIDSKKGQKLLSYFYEIRFKKIGYKGGDFIKASDAYNVKLSTEFKRVTLINHVQFIKDDKLLFTLNTKSRREIVIEGKRTTVMFNILITIFSILFLVVIYRHQKEIEYNNEKLEERLDKRSKQFERSLKKLKKANRALYDIAHTDYLTKIHNRRNFFILSETAFNNAKTKKEPLCVAMFDIDFFKNINDTYGHDIGDEVLIHLSKIVKESLDKNSIFGRLGGEEFAITFINRDLDRASKITERVRSKIEHSPITLKDGSKLKFTASFGVYSNIDMGNIDEILAECDKLLYSAKRDGKNRVYSTRVRRDNRES